MTSPVGHVLGGLIVSRWGVGRAGLSRVESANAKLHSWQGGLFIAFAANAPDLDFIPGIVQGSFGAYHHGPTHSLAAIPLFMLLVALGSKLWTTRLQWSWVAVAGLAYASHILLDLFTGDNTLPYGMQLFWPFSPAYYLGPYALFSDIHHGGVGSGLSHSLGLIFSRHNLAAVGLELLVLLPLWGLSRFKRTSS